MKASNCEDYFHSNSVKDIWATLTRPSTLIGGVGYETINKSSITHQLSDHSPSGGSAYPLMESAITLSCTWSSAKMTNIQDCLRPLNHSFTTPWRYFPSELCCRSIVFSLLSSSRILLPLQRKSHCPNSLQSLTPCTALTTLSTVRGGAEGEKKL